MWLDVSSIHLKYQQWCFDQHPLEDEEFVFLESIKLKTINYRDRHIEKLQFGLAQDCCKVVVTPKNNVGCRSMGAILHNLVLYCGAVKQLPSKIFIQAVRGPIQIRGLLTLSYLCSSQRRGEVFQNYSWYYLSRQNGEDKNDYEKRGVQTILQLYHSCQNLDSHELHRDLKGVQSPPDGLGLTTDKKELIIIEVKMDKELDFAEGTSQIVQYYAQAKNHPRFQHLNVKTHLVTSIKQTTDGYRVWQDLMNSTKELKFFVQNTDIRSSYLCSQNRGK